MYFIFNHYKYCMKFMLHSSKGKSKRVCCAIGAKTVHSIWKLFIAH